MPEVSYCDKTKVHRILSAARDPLDSPAGLTLPENQGSSQNRTFLFAPDTKVKLTHHFASCISSETFGTGNDFAKCD